MWRESGFRDTPGRKMGPQCQAFRILQLEVSIVLHGYVYRVKLTTHHVPSDLRLWPSLFLPSS